MTTLYMLDTDTVSYLVRGQSAALDARVAKAPPDRLCISAVTRGELLYGLHLKQGAHRLAKVVDQFLARVRCLPWGVEAATRFAVVAAELHKSGTPIGTMDAMIAGHALADQAVLVTSNVRHFARVAGSMSRTGLRTTDPASVSHSDKPPAAASFRHCARRSGVLVLPVQ